MTETAHPDPFGTYPPMPGHEQYAHRFEHADTYRAIDDAVRSAPVGNGWNEQFGLQSAALVRSRELRQTYAIFVPTSLPERVEGRTQEFRHCQNDLELDHMFELLTEEPPGDGEAAQWWVRQWFAGIQQMRLDRRAELVAAGVVEPR